MNNLNANIFKAVISKVTAPSDSLGLASDNCLKMITTDVSPEQSFVPGSGFNTLLQVEENRIYRVYSLIDTSNANFYESVDALIGAQQGNALTISNDDGAYQTGGPITNS